MKKIITCSLMIVLVTFYTHSAKAQFNPYADNVKMLTAGIGFSSWGVPIFARFVVPVADNITVGGGLSYQSKGENFGTIGKWRHTIVGIHARGNYHFNELIEIDDQWDLYGGLNLGYYIWNTKWDDSGTSFDYSGSGSGGFSLGIHVGGRYFINDRIGINLEFGGGTVLSGGTIGATFLL